MKKFVESSPLSDPEIAARKLIEIANGVEALQDDRIHIEKINGPFLFLLKGTVDQYRAGIKYAVERGWIVLHDLVYDDPRLRWSWLFGL